MTGYGRSEEEWDVLVESGLKFLIERARMRKVTTYTEMNTTLARRTGCLEFDFDRADERAAMGHLLGLITERYDPESRIMISSLVHYLGANDAGPGFYDLARTFKILPKNASTAARLEFWISQINQVYQRESARK